MGKTDNINKEKKCLDVAQIDSVLYEQNLIEIAVCELRFPTLLGLEKSPPTALQTRLRKKYPHYEALTEVGSFEGAPARHRYLFRSRSKDWNVTVHASAISLETSVYTEFEEFYGRLDELLNESKKLINSDFFTRVGLRYINAIPIENGTIEEWINPELVSILSTGPYGTLNKYVCEVRGYTKIGSYTFRHGIKGVEDSKVKDYFLDFDYYKEDVQYNEVSTLIKEFSKINFSFFSWCIGDKAKKYLGKSTPKKKL